MSSLSRSPGRSSGRSDSPLSRLSAISENSIRYSEDPGLRPEDADRIELSITGRPRAHSNSSKLVSVTYGPIEGDDTPNSSRNLIPKSGITTKEVVQRSDTTEEAVHNTDRLWTPWSLRIWTLLALALFFLLSIIILEILNYISNHHSGLSTQSQSRRYGWTYMPAAIFFLAATVWAQVKYRTQQLMPWRTMAGGAAAASHSILLDYVSSWSIAAFFKSLRAGHPGVSLVVLGSFLIKVVIVASTGLMSIQSVSITQGNMPIQVLNQFGGTIDSKNVNASDAWMGVSTSSTSGIRNNLVIPSFQSLGQTSDAQNVSVVVDVLSADLICEKASTVEVTNVGCSNGTSSSCDVQWSFTVVGSPDCKFNNSIASVDSGPLGTNGVQRFGLAGRATCNNEAATDSDRLVITTGYLDWNQNSTNIEQFTNATATICKPSYAIQQMRADVDGNGNFLSNGPFIGGNRTLDSVNAAQVADAVWAAVNLTFPPHSSKFNESNFFVDFISLVRPSLDLDQAADLETGFRAVYAPIAAQIMKRQLVTNVSKNTTGSVTHAEDRVLVRAVPLRIMEIALALLILITGLLYVARPAPSTPRDTSTIAGLATVLASSPQFLSAIQGLGAASMQTISQAVSAQKYRCCVTDIEFVLHGQEQSFRIDVVASDSEAALEPSRAAKTTAKPETWWIPIYDLTRLSVLGATFLVLMIIELLHQRSLSNHGLMSVDESSSIRYVWSFIPAVIMLRLLSWFGVIDFSTRLLQPYRELKKSPLPAQRTILVNYLSQVTVVTIWKAVANRHIAVLFSALAMLLAPFLTIVSSGLYAPMAISQSTPIKITSTSVLNPGNQKSVIGSQLPVVANAFIYSNASWPSWTSDTLVFPQMSESTEANSQNFLTNRTLDVRTPVMYARLNCSRVATGSILTSVDENTSTQLISVPVPLGCGVPCASINTTNGGTCDKQQSYINLSSTVPADGILFGRMFASKPNPTPEGWNDECPRISVVYGKGWMSSGSIDGLMAMNCFPAILQAEANSTWSLPTWDILSVKLDNSTEKTVARGDNATLDISSILASATSGDEDFDSAFSAITGGRDYLAVADLIAHPNDDGVTAALGTLYARTMAQQLNLNARSPVAVSLGSSNSLNGSIADTHLRLVQDTASTRVLETLLAVAFLCIVLAIIFGDSNKVLPNNPCSIAVMSTLIADSDLVKRDVVPNGSEWCSDGELKKRGVFEGYMLSLGMWDKQKEGGKVGKVFGIDVGKAEKVE